MSARSLRLRSSQRAGLSMVEVTVIISVLGTLLAVAIPTLAKSVRPSKVSEASEQLEILYQAVAAYYRTPRPADPRPDSPSLHCLPEPAGPTPELPSPNPVPTDFGAANVRGVATWQALGFAPTAALRFRYSVIPSEPGCAAPSGGRAGALILRAEGDLDGDGNYSRFERRAQIDAAGELRAEPVLHIEDRVE
jgi:type II secretory pathway pseudopilin PulG